MRCTSVVIADRHPVVLQGLTNVLRVESGFKVVASCIDGRNCIESIRSLVPDIAILDVSMPDLTGLEILAIANSENLGSRVPKAFSGLSLDDRPALASNLIYFSFVTLTTTGYGDIFPVHPIARSLCNVEAIFGQLFPATLLARLVTLEIEHRR